MFRFILLSALMLLPLSAEAERRLGLVIGNDAYDEVIDLQKARADARAVADRLETHGFAVTQVLDGTRRAMNRAISEFTSQLEAGDTAFVFYAGHGVEIDGENYLLPTDIVAPTAGERDFIKSESIALSALLDRVRATGARTTLAIVDACRENPFAATNGRSIGGTRGLGRITAPEGTFVIFSAGAGQLALDRLSDTDASDNSVFTRLLLPKLEQPGLELRAMMSGLRTEVRDLARSVGHNQFPAYYDELLGQFFFTPAAAPAPAPVAEPEPQITTDGTGAARHATAQIVVPGDEAAMRADFNLARELNTADGYKAFIAQYKDEEDAFPVTMAALLLKELEGEKDENAPAKPLTSAPKPVDRRDIIRATQAQLNALSCNAGIADGIAGRRTLLAFDTFLRSSGVRLSPDDLGTQLALDAVNSKSGTVCRVLASKPKPNTSSGSSKTVAAPAKPKARGYSLSGTWSWTATCPLGKTTGTTRCTKTSSNKFSCSASSKVGNGTVYATLNGRSYSATERFGLITNRVNGTLSTNGRTLTTSVSNGCRVIARKR